MIATTVKVLNGDGKGDSRAIYTRKNKTCLT